MEENNRGSWGSNFGFLMAAIGSAVGLGNIWGFPYKMGATGGFAFLLVYLILVIFVGFVVMLGELALGRKTGKGAVGAYKAFSKKHSWVGYLGVASGFIILGFYTVLGGIVIRYCWGFLLQLFGADGFAGQGLDFFAFLRSNPTTMLVSYVIFTVINMVIVMGGIQGGIEKFSTIAMPALAAILVIVIVYVAVQPGAGAGYAFMFAPKFEVFSNPDIGFLGVLKTAAGQMFFSLSLGMGCMITYGSYLSKKEDLQKNSFIIPIADTCIAIMAGMAVLPACAAFGVDYGAGPGLLFSSMQTVFHNMGGFIGNLMGFLFYFLVLIAAVTSSISLLEVCTTFIIDKRTEQGKKPARKVVTLIFASIIFVLGLPVALDGIGYGIANGANCPTPAELLGIGVAGWNDCWLDLYDMISEGIFMPLGALVMALFIGWIYKTSTVKDECEVSGQKFKGFKFYDICFKFIVPIGMAIVLWGQLSAFFGI